jgi:RND family efflux transporter MFP subunit
MNKFRITRYATLCTALALFLQLPGCRRQPAGSRSEENGRVAVRVVAARRLEMADSVSGLGRCEAPADGLAALTPLVEGRIEKMLAVPGQEVVAGQPIVQLDTTLARADLIEKQAIRDSLVASLALLKSLPRSEEQEAVKLAIADARIAVARAQSVVDRLQPLRARNEVSEQQMFEAEQTLAQAKVQQQAAEANHGAMMLGPRSEAVAEMHAKIDVAEKTVASSRAKLDLHIIRAPIDGKLDRLICYPGQTLTLGTTIGQVVDMQRVVATAWLPIRVARSVRAGQSAVVSARDRSQPTETATESAVLPQRSLPGQVVSASRVLDPQTGNVPVRVAVDNTDNTLLLGDIVEVSIAVTEPSDSLAVPRKAIWSVGGDAMITVVRNGKAAVLKPRFGVVNGDWIAISGTDLIQGEPVIVEGAYNLPDGTVVATAEERE